MARDPLRFQPIFVLTVARSYSSVVATMIGQHPELMALPELKLFAYETIGAMAASLPRYWIERGMKHRSPGLVRAIAHFECGGQTAESLAAAREWLDAHAHWSGAEMLDWLLERISPRSGVEKSPENVETGESLKRLSDAYPRARYIHLIRHPVTTQRSMTEHAARTIPGFTLPDQPMGGIASWLETHCRILCFGASLPTDRYLRVRAEDVLQEPRSQLRSIAGWLGIRADDRALDAMIHPEASPFAFPGPPDSGIIGGNDPGFLRNPVLRSVEPPPPLERPAGWVENETLWRRTVDLATQLGYQ